MWALIINSSVNQTYYRLPVWQRKEEMERPWVIIDNHAWIQKVLQEGVHLWWEFFVVVIFSCWGEEGSKYHHKRVNIVLPAKRHLNGVSQACGCWPNIKCWLGSFVIFQRIRTSIAKKPYIFVIFQVGSGPPDTPPPPHLWKRMAGF